MISEFFMLIRHALCSRGGDFLWKYGLPSLIHPLQHWRVFLNFAPGQRIAAENAVCFYGPKVLRMPKKRLRRKGKASILWGVWVERDGWMSNVKACDDL